MDLNSRLRLSYYKLIDFVDEKHDVRLVKHTVTGRIFVMKHMQVYDLRVFEYLKAHPGPGLPRIEELIEADHSLYVVEDYVSGLSLRAMLDHMDRPMDEPQALDIAVQVCRILSPLHRQDPPMVHRDIKPENLIITDDNRVVLVDFNSAKESRQAQGQDTILIGTAGYAAPEQYGFSSSAPTADVYAVGVLLHEMLTGALPTERTYAGTLSSILKKCLEMDPKNRYHDADALLRALTRAQAPEKKAKVQEREAGTHSAWALPGFRNRSLSGRIFAGLGYFFLVGLCTLTEFEGVTAQPALLFNRLGIFFLFFGQVLWFGNYRNIWDRFPLTKSSNQFLKILGILLWSIPLMFPPIMLFSMLEQLI